MCRGPHTVSVASGEARFDAFVCCESAGLADRWVVVAIRSVTVGITGSIRVLPWRKSGNCELPLFGAVFFHLAGRAWDGHPRPISTCSAPSLPRRAVNGRGLLAGGPRLAQHLAPVAGDTACCAADFDRGTRDDGQFRLCRLFRQSALATDSHALVIDSPACPRPLRGYPPQGNVEEQKWRENSLRD